MRQHTQVTLAKRNYPLNHKSQTYSLTLVNMINNYQWRKILTTKDGVSLTRNVVMGGDIDE